MNGDSSGPILVVMAAGSARRYGGLKQLAPVGPAGETLLEYSIHDALAAGFSRIVLVIRRHSQQAFCRQFVDRLRGTVDIQLVYQEPDVALPRQWCHLRREKPWGTGHALLSAAALVDRPFALVNADDFYGASALRAVGRFLGTHRLNEIPTGVMAGYRLANTLSDHGSVSRGVCELDPGGRLRRIVERHNIRRQGPGATFVDADGVSGQMDPAATMSMNLWGFPVEVFDHFRRRFHEFLELHDALQEFEIPSVVQQLIDENSLQVEVLSTDEKWCGLTYREDHAVTRRHLAQLVDDGVYPSPFWSTGEQAERP